MANKHRGYIDIELDKPRRLKFDMNALAELEDVIGKPVSQLNQDTVGIKELRAMVWAGLLHEEPKLTIKGAGDLIQLDRIKEITKKVTEALTIAFSSQSEEKNDQSGQSGTGIE